MYDKDFYRDYEQWNFLERFKGYNVEFNREILKAAKKQGVNLRKVFGKAISNMLKNGKETREILLYATDCFSIGRSSFTEDVQLFGAEKPVGRYCKAYLVELGEDFWRIKFAYSVGEHGESIVHYNKVRMNRKEIQFNKNTGELVGWIAPTEEPMMDMDKLRDV